MWLFALAFVAVGVYLLLQPRGRIHCAGQSLPKPPSTLPVIGNALQFLAPRHDLLLFFSRLHAHFGYATYEISVPTLPPGVVINDPKVLDYVMKHEGPEGFVKGDFFRERSWDLFGGHGIINSSGENWKQQRKTGIRFFSQKRLQHIVDEVFPRFWADSRAQLLDAADQNTEIDMQELFLEFTTRVMGRVAFGMDLRPSHPFSAAFDYASNATGLRFQNPLYKVTELFTGSKFRRCVREVKKFGREMVGRQTEKGELIEMLGEVTDEEAVADAAVNFLSAGRDTTSESLTWTLHLLLRNPSYIPPILLSHPCPATFTSLNPSSTPAIHAAVLESLRLYPPVPFELKQVQHPDGITLPDATYLPPTSIVFWSPWSFGRSTLLWGPDADTFRPSRWIEPSSSPSSTVTLKTRISSEYPVFNGGARLCIGKRLGELIDVWVLPTLLTEFDVVESDPTSERRSRNSLTLPMEGGLKCRIRRRERKDVDVQI